MIPVHILTGFLGSGKTTLLQQMLSAPGFEDSAVIVNEFGEVGLDHLLLEEVEEGVLLMQNGCVCCTVRSDLKSTIRDLQDRVDQRMIQPFSRIVLETTGLADPAPVVSTLLTEPVLRHHFAVGNIICTVDAVNGASSLSRQPESVKQVAVADRIVVTKCDLVEAGAADALCERLARANPAADISRAGGDGRHAAAGKWIGSGIFDEKRRPEELSRWLKPEPEQTHGHEHFGEIRSFCIIEPVEMDWTAFGIWLTALLHAHGQDVLRVKGVLNVRGSSTPVAIHGVQHLVHPPLHLREWPDGRRESRIVFITRGIGESRIRRSMNAFIKQMEATESNPGNVRAADPAPPAPPADENVYQDIYEIDNSPRSVE